MSKRSKTLGKLIMGGLLPNLINDSLPPEKVVEAAVAEGVRAIEVSCRRPDTIKLLRRLPGLFPGVEFGVSSLIEDGPYYRFLQNRGPRFPSIEETVDSGAAFLVSALTFSPETYCRHSHLPIIPGVASQDEAKRQLDLGAALVKFSTASVGGDMANFRAVNGGPLHYGMPLLITGGVRVEHISDLVAAGALVCVCGFDVLLQNRYLELQASFETNEVRSAIATYVAEFARARRHVRPNVDFASGDAELIQRQSGQFMNVPPAAADQPTETGATEPRDRVTITTG